MGMFWAEGRKEGIKCIGIVFCLWRFQARQAQRANLSQEAFPAPLAQRNLMEVMSVPLAPLLPVTGISNQCPDESFLFITVKLSWVLSHGLGWGFFGRRTLPSPFPGHRNKELVLRGENILYFLFYILCLQREGEFPFTQPLFTSCFFVAVYFRLSHIPFSSLSQ